MTAVDIESATPGFFILAGAVSLIIALYILREVLHFRSNQ